ncbi:nucleotidyltransferase domain-containing protein [Rhodanobacter sp. 7MK24]|uniref:nucleotidyltransferase domain-containing protein n=1 Tax=Rhodanobacter sp. 7MK24 TaxID=2775922 RepID=UPI0017868CE9|nr:nucleotidyltransferase domain-containing protein [Rhodanobacter sp. 7MK24]MBD8882426.1 nucleotidyltransferase domain-containing protein [Rhodanobacter sp. 7MK24]
MERVTSTDRQREIDFFVDRFTRQFYPSSTGVIFFGSRSRGAETETSDFDLFVFNSKIQKPYRQHRYLAGWLFDVCVMDSSSCLALCELQRAKRLDYYASVVRSGRVLRDEDGEISKLKIQLNQLMESEITPPNFDFLRLTITCVLNDIEGSRNRFEYVTSCTELYQTLMKCRYLITHRGYGMSVYLTKIFLKEDRSFAQDLHTAYVTAVSGSHIPLRQMAATMLETIGGKVKDGEKFPLVI